MIAQEDEAVAADFTHWSIFRRSSASEVSQRSSWAVIRSGGEAVGCRAAHAEAAAMTQKLTHMAPPPGWLKRARAVLGRAAGYPSSMKVMPR